MSAIKVGDKVRLTGEFLRNTGQAVGSAGLDRWVVTGLDREWAITNEPADTSWFTPEEIKSEPTLKWRRINVGNLEVCK